MCFNHGNAFWCDGGRGNFYDWTVFDYDKYFNDHGENPWGDTDRANRKCNPVFRPYGHECHMHWHCAKGLSCEKKNPDKYGKICK